MADGQDYYQVLGLGREAGADDIRKAYRRLAREYHPDMNGGDARATERFREVNRAYEVLSNPDKRARYDRYGSAGVEPDGGGSGADFGFGGFGDIFDVLFGAGGRAGPTQRGPERGADLRADVEISLEDVLTGTTQQVSVTRLETCAECKGNGARTGTRPQPCVACGGAGAVRSSRQTIFGTMSQVTECYRCHGRGELIADPCPRCGGRGRERQTRRVPVTIPAGIEERQRIQVSGMGEAGPAGGPAGDLYVFVYIRPHPQFRRRGRELTSEIEISFARAALGGKVEIETLDGRETVHVPPGTQPGDVCRLRGKGLSELHRPQARGDQHVIIRVRTPTHLNDRQKRALQEFADASGEELGQGEPTPQKHEPGFFEWVRNLFTGRDEPEPDERKDR